MKCLIFASFWFDGSSCSRYNRLGFAGVRSLSVATECFRGLNRTHWSCCELLSSLSRVWSPDTRKAMPLCTLTETSQVVDCKFRFERKIALAWWALGAFKIYFPHPASVVLFAGIFVTNFVSIFWCLIEELATNHPHRSKAWNLRRTDTRRLRLSLRWPLLVKSSWHKTVSQTAFHWKGRFRMDNRVGVRLFWKQRPEKLAFDSWRF